MGYSHRELGRMKQQ